METILRDIRYSLRRILNAPGFTAVAVLSVALGVGANSTIFTMVNHFLFAELPFSEPEDLYEIYPAANGRVELNALSYPELRDIRKGTEKVFGGIASTSLAVAQENDRAAKVLAVEVVSGNYFQVLGIQPVLGRGFLPEEDRTLESHPVVVLGYRFWQQRYGGDPAAIGETIRLIGRNYTIVGVARPSIPSILPGVVTDLYAPSIMANHLNGYEINVHEERGTHTIFAKGRLLPGVTWAAVQEALDGVVAATHNDYPDYENGWGLLAVPTTSVAIHPLLDRVLFPASGVLMAVVALVLLIACVNLASFLLAQAAARRREVALRLALGGSRPRLVRQLLTESVLLGVLGGAAGFLLAALLLRVVGAIELPAPVPLDLTMMPDGRVMAFTLAISILAGLLFGLFPAWQGTNPDLAPTLKNEAVLGRAPRRLTLRNLLVVGQVAASFVLLVGAGLFLRSLLAAQSTDPGFGKEPTAIVKIGLSPDQYDGTQAIRYFRELTQQAAALPGVRSVGLSDSLALGASNFSGTALNVPGVEPPSGLGHHMVDSVVVDPGFFPAMGVEILAGRAFNWQDQAPVAIISKAMSDRFWPAQDPLGKTIQTRGGEEIQVIGVARDTNVRALGEAPRPYLYLPLTRNSRHTLQILAQVSAAPRTVGNQIVELARRSNPDVLVIDNKTIEEHFGIMLFPFRVAGALLGIFAAVTVLLTSIGLYGVVSYAAVGRTREVGVRMSLGARRWEVVALVMREGMGLVAVGLVIGLGLAWLAVPLLGSLLFGIEPTDALAFAAVSALLASVAALASFLPALRASRVDPVQALH